MTPPSEPPIGRTLAGLLSALFVGMLTSSIVSTSLPRIVADIGGGQSTLTWIVSATLLTITVSTPLWGKLSDLVQRRLLLAAALVIFILGSLVAGLAPSPLPLIGARALQGVGAGGLLCLTQIVLADIISPRERGKYMGLFGAVLAAGTIGGPLVGGFVTDSVGWRWNFFGVVPVALFSLVTVMSTVPRGARPTGPRPRLDLLGALLLSVGVIGALVWVSLAGTAFAWVSVTGIVLPVVSVALLLLFLVVEHHAADPVIPLSLLRSRAYVLVVFATLSVGVSTYGVAVFMAQYLQSVRMESATMSSVITLPQLLCVSIASTVVGLLISRTGRWKLWMSIGAGCQAVGLLALSTISPTTPYPVLWGSLALVGLGIGSVMQNLVLMAENNVPSRHLGVASAGIAFFRSLGGTLGVTALGALVTHRAAAARDDGLSSSTAMAGGIGDAYFAGAVLASVSLLCILLLPNLPLSTRTRSERLASEEEAVATNAPDPAVH